MERKGEVIREEMRRRCELFEMLRGDAFVSQIEAAFGLIEEALARGGKLLICGNGGSAAEAQHFAAELVCRFEKKRRPIAALALTTDTSILTAQANDESFSSVFARQIEALGRPEDALVGFTTSDAQDEHSRNIFEAFRAATTQGIRRLGFFSARTKTLLPMASVAVVVPHTRTAIIQEAHLCVVHILCRLLEEKYDAARIE